MSKPILQIWDEASQKYVPIPAIKGKDGKDGADGKDGTPGKDGTDGTNGTNGKDGAKWYAAIDAPSDAQDGDMWLYNGSTPHPDGYGLGDIMTLNQSVWQLAGNIRGAAGSPGSDASVTAANIASAQGYTSANEAILDKVIAATCDEVIVSGGNYNLLKISEVEYSRRLQDDVAGAVASTAQNAVTGWIPVESGKCYSLSYLSGEKRVVGDIRRINLKLADGSIIAYGSSNSAEWAITTNGTNIGVGARNIVCVPESAAVSMRAQIYLDANSIGTASALSALEPMLIKGDTAIDALNKARDLAYLEGDTEVPAETEYKLRRDDTKQDKIEVSPYRRNVNYGAVPADYYQGVGTAYSSTTFGQNTSYATFIAAWKALVAGHTGYVTETNLGQASDDQSIYVYRFKPVELTNRKTPIPKVIIIAGQHGFEKSNIYGLYYLVDNLLNRWNQHPALAYLRNHVELMIVPALNTYGFDHNQYTNGNGVSLNRNYDSYWELVSDTTSSQYGGAAPFDQPETQIVKNLLLANTDAALVVDFHTNGSAAVAQYSYINYYGICQSTDSYYNRMLDAVAYQLANISGNVNLDYSLGQPDVLFGFLNHGHGTGLLRDWATDNNFVGVLVEGFNGFPGGTAFTGTVYKANEEIMANWLITALRYLAN